MSNSQMNANVNINNMVIRFFYTKSCSECHNILQCIFTDGIGRLFAMICVDDFTSEQIANLKLRRVPAIVISYRNKNPEIYEGASSCSNWLKMFTYNWKLSQKQRVTNQMKLIQQARIKARKKDGALEYIEAEMEGMQDNYSYNATDLCQPKNFVTVGNEAAANIITPQLKQSKMSREEITKQMKELEKKIQNDTNKFKEIMERKQIEAVFNNNMS